MIIATIRATRKHERNCMNWFGLFKKKESVEPEKKPLCQWHHWHSRKKNLVDPECAHKEKVSWFVDICCQCETMKKMYKEW